VEVSGEGLSPGHPSDVNGVRRQEQWGPSARNMKEPARCLSQDDVAASALKLKNELLSH